MTIEKISPRRIGGLASILALSISMGALTACASDPVTTTTRTVTTDTTAPAPPAVQQTQTTTVQRSVTTP